jgi:uncharacterized SAM-binding protein YcdF (DUF218 family)
MTGKERRVITIIGVLAAAFAGTCAVLGSLVVGARRDEAQPADAILVLGAEQRGGVPTPVFRARLDHALALYRRGLAPQVILTGGVGRGQRLSEAEAARRYLTARGVPPAAILAEYQGDSTWSSLQFAAEVMRPLGIRRVILVSDAFHLPRSTMMARVLGMEPYRSPAPGSPIRPWSRSEMWYAGREALAFMAWLAGLRRTRGRSGSAGDRLIPRRSGTS